MEGERTSIIPTIVGVAALAVVGGLLTNCAFTTGIRNQILARDGGCVKRGPHYGELEASHKNHNKPEYNTPENGECLCTYHHLLEHQKMEGRNGLCRAGNKWAIEHLVHKLTELSWKEI